MGDENVELVKGIYEKLKNKSSETWSQECVKGSDPSIINSGNKRLFNSAALQDHHAIIPLDYFGVNCTDEELLVYMLVFERFFAALKPPYIYNSIAIEVSIAGYNFFGNGIEVLQSGWKEKVDLRAGWKKEPDFDNDEEQPENYAGLEKGSSYLAAYIQTLDKKTEPKKHFTFASLLQLMENPHGGDGAHLSGLGTPATRGSILQKLVDRKYILLKGKKDKVVFVFEEKKG